MNIQTPKNKSSQFVAIFAIVAIIAIASWLFYYSNNKTTISTDEDIISFLNTEEEEVEDSPAYNQEDALIFKVSSRGDGPKITKVIIAPQKVGRGEKQYLEVWIKDDKGVKDLITETELDRGIVKTLTMKLFDGTPQDGKWQADWIVHDTHDETYRTKFKATAIDGRKTDITYGWTDPCSPPLTGDWNLPDYDPNDPNKPDSYYCDQGGAIGAEGGSITIGKNVNLILSNGTTLGFNPGQSIDLSRKPMSISLSGGKIQKGYLFALDNDGDGQVSDYFDTNGDGVVDAQDKINALARQSIVLPANQQGSSGIVIKRSVALGGNIMATTYNGQQYTRYDYLGKKLKKFTVNCSAPNQVTIAGDLFCYLDGAKFKCPNNDPASCPCPGGEFITPNCVDINGQNIYYYSDIGSIGDCNDFDWDVTQDGGDDTATVENSNSLNERDNLTGDRNCDGIIGSGFQ